MTNNLPDDQLPPLPPTNTSDDHLTPPPPSSVKAPTPPGAVNTFGSKPQPTLTPSPTLVPPSLTTPTHDPSTQILTPLSSNTETLPPIDPTLPSVDSGNAQSDQPMTPISTAPAYASQTSNTTPPSPFSNHPMPEADKQRLEAQAQQLIKDSGGIKPPKKSSPKMMQTILGALALVLVGAGVFFGQKLISMEGIGDVRQQASLDDIPMPNGGCPADYPFAYNNWCYKIDPTKAKREVIACPPEYNINPQLEADRGGCLKFTNNITGNFVICYPTPGGGLACSGLRDGSTCAPVMSGGGDWCTLIGGGVDEETAVSCASLGLSRCSCNNGIWIIGVGSCSEICGSTGNTCDEPCRPPEITSTPPPEIHLGCYNNTCAYLAGGGPDTCDSDSDCSTSTPPPTTPPPTVTPTPGQTLACTGMTSVPANPKLGDSVRYTCSGTTSPGAIHHYGFQYKVGSGAFTNLAATAVGSAQSAPLTISEPGTYTVRCRACKSTDDSNCTAWQSL